MYSYDPSGLITTVPPLAVGTDTGVVAASPVAGSTTDRLSAGFSSLSLSNTSPMTGVSRSVTLISSSATGAGSVICRVSVAVSVPSLPSSML